MYTNGLCKSNKSDCSQIEIKADKTFGYLIYSEPNGSGSFTSGTWEYLANDTIILNTTLQPEIPKTNYTGKINPELDNKIRIYFSDKNGPLEYAMVSINGKKEEKKTNYKGMVEFKTSEIKSIKYRYIMVDEEIQINNPNYNDIEIEIKDQDIIYPEYLKDYKARLNGRKLILDSVNIYKKTNIKNKQWYN
ncbi:hypothetical protein ACPX19_06340 [Winogradskyella sp. HB-48]|uniref:hypothetical protein n=1 Tax=Winogradskyella sp. HB-48 TaxID=3416808 RepID=UPI003CE9C7B8